MFLIPDPLGLAPHRYTSLCTQLQLTPETTEAMDEQEKFMALTAAELTCLAQQIASSQQTFQALQSSQYITEEEESEAFWGMRRWPNKLAEVRDPARWNCFGALHCLHLGVFVCVCIAAAATVQLQ